MKESFLNECHLLKNMHNIANMIHLLFKCISSVHILLQKAKDRFLMFSYRTQFASCGKKVVFFPTKSFFFYKTITMGDDVYIGPGATFVSSESFIQIGNKVMFVPNVTIIGGDHNTSIVGSYMCDVNEKLPENDLPVIIEDDVWVGAGAIILKGVTIARGSIVASGALVNQNVPAYAIVGGQPAKVIKYRWDSDTIIRHEALLYQPKCEDLTLKVL
jgi:acetyltransferase-like isoleucine patch superfamily enzyme